LLSSARFNRLVEQEALDGSTIYAPSDFLADVRKGIWKELSGPQVRIDAYRRNLQRAYLDLTNAKVNANTPALPAGLPPELAGLLAVSGEERPLYRAELKTLRASIVAAIPKAADRETRAHLEGARDQIAKILDPRFASAQANVGAVIRIGIDDERTAEGIAGFDPLWGLPGPADICWRDYVIRPD
jgi:hypothetical protein